MNSTKEMGELLTGIGTVILSVTAFTAVLGYIRQIKVEKLRWLQQIYEKFYDQKRYKPVRQRIDFDDLTDLLPLLRRTQEQSHCPSTEDRNKIDQFTDYLNFFEWISFLEDKGELSFDDVDVMFNYYLKRIVEIDDKYGGKITKYIIENGYEKFLGMLSKHYSPSRVNLFVYGTLKKGGELHEELTKWSIYFLGRARIKGKLFQIENESYPGAIAVDSDDYIMGELYEIEDPLNALWKIDIAEGCDEGLFERKIVDAWLDGRKVKAWSYFYLKPVDKSIRIESGYFSNRPMLKPAHK